MMRFIRTIIVFKVLLAVKLASRCLYRFRSSWVGERPRRPWRDIRLIVVLNHTSLFEPLYAGIIPVTMLWQVAKRCVAPAAAKTIDRPFVGRFYKLLGDRIIPVSRQRDSTWQSVLDHIDPESIVIVFPEGRMKRVDGLDRNGKPMTVRGGIADILQALPGGRMLIAYSGGLHHVQSPGELAPRLFKTLRLKLENLSIESYRESLPVPVDDEEFKHAVIEDLERRRDSICPEMEELSYAGTPLLDQLSSKTYGFS